MNVSINVLISKQKRGSHMGNSLSCEQNNYSFGFSLALGHCRFSELDTEPRFRNLIQLCINYKICLFFSLIIIRVFFLFMYHELHVPNGARLK